MRELFCPMQSVTNDVTQANYTSCVSLDFRRLQTGYCFVDSDQNTTGNAICASYEIMSNWKPSNEIFVFETVQ